MLCECVCRKVVKSLLVGVILSLRKSSIGSARRSTIGHRQLAALFGHSLLGIKSQRNKMFAKSS